MASDDTHGDKILGCGIAFFPLQLEGGTVGMNAYDLQVKQSIRLILGTGAGERVMRPDFGGNLERLAFEPMSAATVSFMQHQVRETLIRFEPRIDVLDVAVTPDLENGLLVANIQYRLKRTNSIFNLVYPFYLERGER
jgi:phage baseplate assembly protein W